MFDIEEFVIRVQYTKFPEVVKWQKTYTDIVIGDFAGQKMIQRPEGHPYWVQV